MHHAAGRAEPFGLWTGSVSDRKIVRKIRAMAYRMASEIAAPPKSSFVNYSLNSLLFA